MNISFAGKRALVTGAGSGIGRDIATNLAKCGAKVIGLDISERVLATLKTDIPDLDTIQTDLSSWERTKESIRTTLPVDLLVNNAGLGVIAPLTEVTEDSFDRSFNVNVKALINVTQTVVGDLLQRKAAGAIVNISSQASKAGLLHHTIYCASKGAVDAFTRAAALELGPYNIRINCVNPTVVMTDLGRKIWTNPEMGGPMLAKIPLNRFAETSDVVAAVLFLLSDKASMITGTCLPVDGGFLAC